MIVGIDEVGRGPWAGPLVFGAVVLGDTDIEGLTDSKKLSKKRREALSAEIHEKARSVGLGWVSAAEIDEIGLSQALVLACKRALEGIDAPYHQIIIDGTINFLKDTGKGPYVTTMARADLLVPSVSAASIVAKVARDQFMAEQDEVYAGYGFASHVGYGTVAHRQAIETHGVTPLHRLSFAPLAKYAGSGSVAGARSTDSGALGANGLTVLPRSAGKAEPSSAKRAPTTAGAAGEQSAAAYLQKQGYTIIARNWKTKACEIDIIARRGDVVHFVEVKYRRVADQGGGIAAITPKKLKQMERAAKLWQQRYGEQNALLSVVEVAGPNYEISLFLEQV
jgi:ribonuclease HII